MKPSPPEIITACLVLAVLIIPAIQWLQKRRYERWKRLHTLERWDLLEKLTDARYSLTWYRRHGPAEVTGIWVVYDQDGNQLAQNIDPVKAIQRALRPAGPTFEL